MFSSQLMKSSCLRRRRRTAEDHNKAGSCQQAETEGECRTELTASDNIAMQMDESPLYCMDVGPPMKDDGKYATHL